VTQCDISEHNGNAYVQDQIVKTDTRRAGAASLYSLSTDTFEDFHFDAPTEEKNYCERMTPAQKERTKPHVSSNCSCSSAVICT